MNWMKLIVESAGNVEDKKKEAGIFSTSPKKQQELEQAEKKHERLLKNWRKSK